LEATTIALAGDARASGPVGVEVAFTPGGALYPWKGNSPLGLGLGGRAGVLLDQLLYVGVSVMDYLGTTGADPSGFLVTKRSQLYGGLLGYAFAEGDAWSVRLQLGVGEATVNEHGSSPASEFIAQTPAGITVHSLYLEPGIGLIVKPWGPLLVGADVTVLVLGGIPYVMDPPSTTVALVLQAQLGVAF
jgi:hypothetical protein